MKKPSLLVFIAFFSVIGFSQSYSGTIINVIDGDTYVFQTSEGSFKVRTLGTGAPENQQPYSKESAEFLLKYLNKDAITKVTGTDRYCRSIGILYVQGKDINLLSIKNGCSWHYKQYSKDQSFADAEIIARKNRIGLWGLANPTPPWRWRKNKQEFGA
jgi:micrococcal nuclease